MILRSLLLLPFCFFGQKIEYQKLFQRANLNIESCDSLVKYCESETTATGMAYYAAGLMLKSKHERKLKYFKIVEIKFITNIAVIIINKATSVNIKPKLVVDIIFSIFSRLIILNHFGWCGT